MTSGEQRDDDLSIRMARIEERITAADRAVEKAFDAREEHDAQTNRIVETLREVIQDCLRKDEYDRRHDELDKRIVNVERTVWKMIGGLIVLWSIFQVMQHYMK